MKAETIIQHISKLERELYKKYEAKEIKEAIEKCEANKTIPVSCDDLISVIYEGVTNELDAHRIMLEDMKDYFIEYEKIRRSGKYNMITEAKFVAEEMGVKLDYYYSIIKNYSELKEIFKDYID